MIRMFDRVTDKLTTQSSAADSTDPSAIGRKKSKQGTSLSVCLVLCCSANCALYGVSNFKM